LSRTLLIIGGSGLVGSTLIQYGMKKYNLHVTINKNDIKYDNIPFTRLNLLDEKNAIISLIERCKPDVVIHTAAHSSVDLCETNPHLADILHVDVTKDIAKICKETNSKIIFLSTDAVFEGELDKKYTESDKPNPINHYGKTKLQAEQIILKSSSKNVILRTAVIYGWHERSRFTNWIIQTLMNKKMVDPFIDQYSTPTLVDDLVKAILKIIDLDICGLYHVTGKTCINRYDFALELAKAFGLNKDLIKPVTSLEKKQDAPRPISTCLDSSKLENLIEHEFSDIKTGISFILNKSKQTSTLICF